MITEDILEWVATLPKRQQKLSYVFVEKMRIPMILNGVALVIFMESTNLKRDQFLTYQMD